MLLFLLCGVSLKWRFYGGLAQCYLCALQLGWKWSLSLRNWGNWEWIKKKILYGRGYSFLPQQANRFFGIYKELVEWTEHTSYNTPVKASNFGCFCIGQKQQCANSEFRVHPAGMWLEKGDTFQISLPLKLLSGLFINVILTWVDIRFVPIVTSCICMKVV